MSLEYFAVLTRFRVKQVFPLLRYFLRLISRWVGFIRQFKNIVPRMGKFKNTVFIIHTFFKPSQKD